MIKTKEQSHEKEMCLPFHGSILRTVGHPVPVLPGQRHDRVCPHRLVLYPGGLGPDDRPPHHLFLRALCGAEPLCWGPQRPMGQEADHAAVRQLCRGHHSGSTAPAVQRPSGPVAHLSGEPAERRYEYPPAAGQRGGGQRAGPGGAVSAGGGPALPLQLPGDHALPGAGYSLLRLGRSGGGDPL